MNRICELGLLEQAELLRGWLVDIRRNIHANAEVGFDLPLTLAYVNGVLDQLNIEHHSCGRAGIIAQIGEGNPTFLLRADMDGLPIAEQTGVEYASTNGNMHACGHDMHTAMLLGAAKLLKQNERNICGTVKLMFQSAEEIFEGANDMIANGALTSPDVGGAMMLHVVAGLPLPSGSIIVCAPGVSAPSADLFTITVHGKGCHGSMPEKGVDPLSAGAHIVVGLQQIIAREIAMGDKAAVTVGSFHGGQAQNVIPDSVTIGGSIRCFDEGVRAFVKERVVQIAEGVASSFRAKAKVEFSGSCPSLFNDERVCNKVAAYTKELLGDRSQIANPALGGSAGSEDFAWVSRKVPSVMLALAAGTPQQGYVYPQHHPKVNFDESVLPTGSATLAYCALRWLEDGREN